VIERVTPALRRWQTWVSIFLWVAVAYVCFLLITGLLTPAAPTTSTDNQMVMHGIAAQGQHGRNGWKFEADSSEISADGYTTTYRGVHDATYSRDGRPTYRLTAGVVTVDSRNQNYSATGGVHVRSASPTMPEDLQTDSAYWEQAEQTLTCTAPTRFIYHGTTMHTSNMTVNMETGAAQLGDTAIDYVKGSPTPSVSVSAAPITISPTPTSTNR